MRPRDDIETDVTTNEDRAQATRGALIAAARSLFADRGYAAVGTEEIVRAAKVTRGALYHHFDGKTELFAAVVERVEAELTARIAADAMAVGEPDAALRAGARAFLEAALDPAIQRILLLDAPSVLGWERWREIGMRNGLGLVTAALEAAMEAGTVARQPVRPLAHILIAALDEGALLLAQADDVATARDEVWRALESLIDGLAPRGA